jgi:hypothetical protein
MARDVVPVLIVEIVHRFAQCTRNPCRVLVILVGRHRGQGVGCCDMITA